MIRTFTYRVMMLVATLLLAITSVSSASRLAPVDMAQEEIVAFLAAGGSLEDLCDDTQEHRHAEHCPFCNTVSEAGNVVPTGKVWQLSPANDTASLAARTFDDQRITNFRRARGPPAAT